MARKRVRSWWEEEISRRFATGTLDSVRVLVEVLRSAAKPGQKPPSKSTIAGFVKDLRESATKAEPAPAVVPPELLAAPNRAALTLDELSGELAGLFRQQQSLARTRTEEGDHAGAERARRLAGYFAAQVAKLQSKEEDDGDAVRVTKEAMQKAGERAIRGLATLAERVGQERAKWPTCPTCKMPHGEYPPADKSPLRALVERVFGRSL